MKEVALVIGSSGQIGTDLTIRLKEIYGYGNVICSDIRPSYTEKDKFENLDATNKKELYRIVSKYQITDVYLLAAMLSATAENNIKEAWDLNMNSLFNVLELAREKVIRKIFWPSSIAVFGPDAVREMTPQNIALNPKTVYGISKLSGERWCDYYNKRFGIDVRSIRFPGLIGWNANPGGGTTDYAVHIFHEAIKSEKYDCFLNKNTCLPMLYMPDAIDAIIKLMGAKKEKITIRSSYNISSISFTPELLAEKIRCYISKFKISYSPDARQIIANDWPNSIDGAIAKNDWGWNLKFDLDSMVEDMFLNLKKKYKEIA